MNTFHQLPIPELRPFVDRLWGWESVSQEVIPLPTLLPGTGAELYFHYGEPFRIETQGNRPYAADRGHLFCIRRAPVSLLPASGIGFVAVRFKIGMLHRFASIPADELADCHLSAEDISGENGHMPVAEFILRNRARRKNCAHPAFLGEPSETRVGRPVGRAGNGLALSAMVCIVD